MITLKKLLETLTEDTKASQERRKRFRMVNEGGEISFELDAKEFADLNNVAKKFGADLKPLVDMELQEKEKPEYLKMTSAELEEGGYVVKIDKSIFDGLDEIMDLGMQAKKWYEDMNTKILSAMNESDGCLFLILLGIFASFSRLSDNFKLASQVYTGIKKDLSDPKTEAQLLRMIEMSSTELYKSIKERGEFKNLATVQGMIKGNKSLPTVLPNILRTLKLYKSKNYTFQKQDVAKEIGKHIKPTTGELMDTKVISSEKILAFCLNLIDPTYKTESGWMPVTMDIWMATFFYPELSTKEKRKLLAKNANYVYLAKLTHELAAKYNMEPLEMQAIIWVGKIRKVKGDNYLSTFDQAIEHNLNKFQIKIEELKESGKVFEEIISLIGNKAFS
jgi:hypothetical protein